MNLTPHFTLEEMILSQTAVRNGISNKPDAGQITSLTNLCTSILEPLRTLVGKSINVTSGFRSPAVNSLVGGSATSQHMKGEAADINVEGFTPQQLFDLVKSSALPYDQLIQEFNTWVHISFGPKKRRDNFIATKSATNKTIMTRV